MDKQPPVVAMAELIEALGLSKSRVVQLIALPDFPDPVAVLGVGKIWDYADIQAYAKRTGRTLQPITPR
ncbi:MAG: phage transcriptional regulator, AlpA [Frankiales bacterium]|nr:phage transcriptional regulator, AlpA [Frankiales bacterium]